jgi:hypothetical protein
MLRSVAMPEKASRNNFVPLPNESKEAVSSETAKLDLVDCRMKKPRRAQPRKATPPIHLRDFDGNDRCILMLDDTYTTTKEMRTTTRSPLFIQLSPGVKVSLDSRRVMKRRYPLLRISVPSVDES